MNSLYETLKGNQKIILVAEIGMNHNGSVPLAKEMIEAAAEAGADYAKLQSYVTELLHHPESPAFAPTKAVELGFDDQQQLFDFAAERNINLFSTVYDFKSAEFLSRQRLKIYKVASMDLNNLPLLGKIASYGGEIILSTGMADLAEVEKSVNFCKKHGTEKIILLHCISDYPAKCEDMNLAAISTLRSHFNCPVGLSDHSLGLEIPVAAVAMGANIIEKHFTLDKKMAEKFPDADHDISLDKQEFKKLRQMVDNVSKALGTADKYASKSEDSHRNQLRRGMYAAADLAKGEEISPEKAVFLRPVAGITPDRASLFWKKKLRHGISKYEPIKEEDIT